MRTTSWAVAALALALALSAPARGAEGPGYVGAAIAGTTVEAKIDIDSFEDTSTGYKIYGGYRFMTNFGLEAAWVDFGEHEDTSTGATYRSEMTGWVLEGVGVLPLGEKFELFGKAGMIYANSETVYDGGLSPSATDDDAVNLTVGAGAAFAIGHVGFRLELEYFDIDETDAVYAVSAGIEYRF